MNEYQAMEQAFKNGYDKGVMDTKIEVERLQAEIERLTINMNAYGLSAKRLAEENERLRKQLEPFKEKQCFTCKHYDIGHDHVPCYYCEDYNKYIWLSADADTEVTT